MSKGPFILWLAIELVQLYLTPATSEIVVMAFLGQSVTLPCTYASWSSQSNSMCWGRGSCPKSKCNQELLHTDGTRVISSSSAKYKLLGRVWAGDISLTISNTNKDDSGVYCCRIEVPGWFNDVKQNIRLLLRAPTTTHPTTTTRPTTTTHPTTTTRPTTTTHPTTTTWPTTTMHLTTTPQIMTTTAVLPTTVVTTPDLTTRTPLQTRATTALATTAKTCPLTTPSSLPEAATDLLTTEPSTAGSTLTAESEDRIHLSTSEASTWKMRDSVTFSQPGEERILAGTSTGCCTAEEELIMTSQSPASKMTIPVQNEVESEQVERKIMKTNCLQKHTRLENVGESKNVLNDMQHEREDEDGLFTL
ncbi:PREDICTED: T-cell immunoglobulin and mucin domain-containing protein 4 [Galeopterus variegatus]|uniref:T-cell immunoglobulin and mucin domain-containing protein 4 n=1 Tax=Galeopterus variegatus TaxID=482537 RepID=UPI0004D0683A|nr:PREDICTED: T-cell immunoglobulin and mucin domain-containing protein 4 [Galeopterus variegatus]